MNMMGFPVSRPEWTAQRGVVRLWILPNGVYFRCQGVSTLGEWGRIIEHVEVRVPTTSTY